jgi:hypothetical protein
MPDHNHKQPYNRDDEIEIVDLSIPKKDILDSPDRANRITNRRISLRSRYSLKQRRRQIIISSSIVLILLTILIGSVSPTRDFILAKFSPHTKVTPEGARASSFFYFQIAPTWGKWYLDGQQLKYAPVFSDEQPLRIVAGKHIVTWHAGPFPDQSCTLLVPPDPVHQTCHTRRQGGNEFAGSSSVINLPVPPSIAQLPPQQRLALLQATRDYLATLQSNETVQPGEMYRYNTDSPPRIATQTMQARLRFQLDTDSNAPATCTGPQLGPACTNAATGSDCRLFCTLAWSERDTPDRLFSWDVGVITRPNWEYIAPDQETDTQAVQKENQGNQQFTTLHITWMNNQWHVTSHPQGDSPFDDPNCIAVVGKIPNMLPVAQGAKSNGSGATFGNGPQQIIRNFASGTNRAMGCLATAKIDQAPSLINPEQQPAVAYFLWRFNVLLAVNDQAHLLWKELPISGTMGKNIVQKITEHIAFES